jgi:hypothetical protein
MGNGRKVRIGQDPWMGADEEFQISNILIRNLHEADIFSLADGKSQPPQVFNRLGWKLENELGLEGDEVAEWHRYFGKLCSNFIRLDEKLMIPYASLKCQLKRFHCKARLQIPI